MIRLNFRTKVLAPVIGVMVLLVAVTVYVVNRRLMLQFQTTAQNTLTTADTVFQNLQAIHSEDLLLRFHGLVNQPLYVAAFPTGDPATLREPLQKLLGAEQDVAIVFYATNASNVLVSEQRDSRISPGVFAKAAGPAVRQALEGRPKVDTVSADDHLYEVISIPVYDTYKNLIGALTLGSEIGTGDAKKFSDITRSQILLFADGRIIASTLTNSSIASFELADLVQNAPPDAGVRQVPLGDAHYFYITGKFNSLGDDKSLGYVLLSSYEDSLLALKATQRVLVVASLCAILIGGAIIWLLVNKVTDPLRQLRDGAEAVGRGDFSHRVPVDSTDECGELAVTFNKMTDNIRQSRAELEKTVETLKSTQEQLIQSEKLSAVGEFVAGVAHELNNPLAAVTGFAELLRETNLETQYRRQLDLIFKAAQRCQKIVQSLLSFARRHAAERKPVCANELVEAVLEIVAYPLRTSNVQVETNLDSHLPAMMADGHQIQQVLLNIINNARQAMEGKQSGGKITISTTVCGPNVRVTIQDNGPGIAPENLRRIFDPFFTTKEVGKGTGLGLSLCYGIIKEHGGDIRVESGPGKGATFFIELPIAPGATNTVSNGASSDKYAPDPREGIGRKVLVIDDEEAVLEMVSDSLSRSGYEVDTVVDGESGLRRLKQNHYDVALCDWKMPGLNGRQVYDQLGASQPELCRRIIFITGDVINEQMQEFLKAENRPCLGKPFALSDLRAAIKATLETI